MKGTSSTMVVGNSTLRGFIIGFLFGAIITLSFDSMYFQTISGNWMEKQRQSIMELHPDDRDVNGESDPSGAVRPVEDSDDFEANGELLDMVSDVEGRKPSSSSSTEADEKPIISGFDEVEKQIGFMPVLWEDVDEKWKLSEQRILEQKAQYRKGAADRPSFFFYQPSGGWGNQRYQLMWAIIAANAMNRTLILPPIGPHSSMWYNFNKWPSSALLPMARVLNMEALNRAVYRGIVSFNDTIYSLKKYLPHLNILDYRRPENAGWWSYQKIRSDFLTPDNRKYDVIFWSGKSMWCCCGATGPFKEYYARHVMFNTHIKQLGKRLIKDAVHEPFSNPNATYNAVHVRRGDHVTGDRTTALRYWKEHDLQRFDRRLPLYVATDETDLTWFDEWQSKPSLKRFTKMIFWKDLRKEWIEAELRHYPKQMHGDILGFLEIIICAFARRWEGSNGSTFSQAIFRARTRKELRAVNFAWPAFPSGSE